MRIQVRLEQGTGWPAQAQMAELCQVTVKAVSEHLQNIVSEGEIEPERTIRKLRIVQTEGQREVRRQVEHYHLDAIPAVGYRVRSTRGTQFRQWATARLSEYLVKGFVMDDARLKDPAGRGYKVRDLFALSVDHGDSEQQASLFFAEVQNKLQHAVTGNIAAELVVARADPGQPNMGSCTREGGRMRKADVIVAKNHLAADEVDSPSRLVVIFLEQAELRVKDRKTLTLDCRRENMDRLLAFNDRAVLENAGSVSNSAMKDIACERYGQFNAQRRRAAALAADADDLKVLDAVGQSLKSRRKPKAT